MDYEMEMLDEYDEQIDAYELTISDLEKSSEDLFDAIYGVHSEKVLSAQETETLEEIGRQMESMIRELRFRLKAKINSQYKLAISELRLGLDSADRAEIYYGVE